MPEYVVSACLAGRACRYDGGSKPVPKVAELCRTGRGLAICPESLSGLPVPRLPCERQPDGRILDATGNDRSAEFEKGARKALELAKNSGCRKAILKSRSPSCGHGQIYDGSFSKTLCAGEGVWTRLLLAENFEICDEEHLPPDI